MPDYTLSEAASIFAIYGTISIPDGDTRHIILYDDEDDAELHWPITTRD